MADFAHEWTDKQIEELEERVRQIYEQASKEMRQKFLDFKSEFIALNAEKQEQLRNGLITNEEYTKWKNARNKEVARLREMSEMLADELCDSNRIALRLVYDRIPDVYALNYDYVGYEFNVNNQHCLLNKMSLNGNTR